MKQCLFKRLLIIYLLVIETNLGFTINKPKKIISVSDSMLAGFINPLKQAKPRCYWYWVNDSIPKEGITKDLKTMANMGIGEAYIWNIQNDLVHDGYNSLEVEIINTWNNRLVHDAGLPADKRKCYINAPTVKADSPLLPTGLMGTVTIHFVKTK